MHQSDLVDQNILNFLPEREQSEVYKLLSPHVLMTEPVAADFLNGKLFAHLLMKEICHRQTVSRGSSQLSNSVCHCCFASVNILRFDAVHQLMFLLAAHALDSVYFTVCFGSQDRGKFSSLDIFPRVGVSL